MLKRFSNTMCKGGRGCSPVKQSSYSSSGTGRLTADTTLFKKEVRPKIKREKRNVINDKDITPTIFEKLKLKCVRECESLSQREIIELLYPLHISNITLARIINDLVEGANATQGSIASMIRFIKRSDTSKKMAQELDRLLEDL